jgi:hypothetical protein
MANKEIKLLGKDYASLKEQLVDFLKTYFPDSNDDFSENSPSMALVELAAYVGDILSYYQDRNFNEVFLERATEYKNVVAAAKNLGYKPRNKRPSYGKIDVTAIFSSSSERIDYGFVLQKGTQFSSKTVAPVIFETLYDVDFSKDDENTIATLSANQYYVTKKDVSVVSGTTKTYQVFVSSAQKFLKITIPEKNVFNIESIYDSNNGQYFEVESLAQDSIMTSFPNTTSSSANTENNLKLKYVPKRFVTSIDGQGFTVLTFGSGINNVESFDYLPAPEDYTINQTLLGKNNIPFSSVSIDNFLTTNSLGYAPNNTTLNITYTKGGGKETNVGVGVISRLVKSKFVSKNPAIQNSSLLAKIVGNLQSYNREETSGGDDGDTIQNISYIAPKSFSAQKRISHYNDFSVFARSMPSKYGSVYRCSAKVDSSVNNTVNLYILSKIDNSSEKTFQYPNSYLKENLKNYLNQYRSFNDVITINSANIIDIGIDYSIRIDALYSNSQEILGNTLLALKNYFDIKNWDIEKPIYLSKISNIITSIRGVLSVENLTIVGKPESFEGRNYTTLKDFDVNKNVKNGKLICPPNSVFQIRYPLYDISGSFVLE